MSTTEDFIKTQNLLILQRLETKLTENPNMKSKEVKKTLKTIRTEMGMDNSLKSEWSKNIRENKHILVGGIATLVASVLFWLQQPLQDIFALLSTSWAMALIGILFSVTQYIQLYCNIGSGIKKPEVRKGLEEWNQFNIEQNQGLLDNFKETYKKQVEVKKELKDTMEAENLAEAIKKEAEGT